MAVIMPHSVFIHVPKTGGTWCRAAIKRLGIPHFESGPNVKRKTSRTHAQLRKAYPTISVKDWRKGDNTPTQRLIFGFVRNPMTWLESRWADAIRKYGGVADHDISNWFKAAFDHDFSKYIDNVIRIMPGAPSMAMLGRLGYHKVDGLWVPEERTADFIGRNESLVEDFIAVMTRAGERVNSQLVRVLTPQRVASRLDRYKRRISWTPEQRRAIYEANEHLCNAYGYVI